MIEEELGIVLGEFILQIFTRVDDHNIGRNAVAITQRRRDVLRLTRGRGGGGGEGGRGGGGGGDDGGGEGGSGGGDGDGDSEGGGGGDGDGGGGGNESVGLKTIYEF
ncbi:hypothetical protein C1645_831688 [Glomus cerebriforme]|uniref:Uncharacterized protein n=1 Tax=Glomus cerebriforme TaxID=658196 RepID=A0A397SH14_9GLOM|nr:hypothetical protein C1645_831688 [Glomus cerebriforme]